MIRRGKAEGWLQLPITALPAWAALNGVKFQHVAVESVPDHQERGSGIIAKASPLNPSWGSLLEVPGELVLSLETVERQSRFDPHLKEVLDAVGDFSKV